MRKFGLNGNQLKLIALITMAIDHIGMYFFPHIQILRIIGRLSMPIFAFMIAEGCRYTGNKKRYILLTAGVGLLCQVVYFVAMRSLYQCILITFTLSILLIFCIQRVEAQQDDKCIPLLALCIGIVFFLCNILPDLLHRTDYEISYGLCGVLLPVFCYLGRNRKQQLLLTGLGLILLSLSLGDIQWYSLSTLLLLALYNGTRGKRKMKYLFYIFYPAHLALLYLIGQIVR